MDTKTVKQALYVVAASIAILLSLLCITLNVIYEKKEIAIEYQIKEIESEPIDFDTYFAELKTHLESKEYDVAYAYYNFEYGYTYTYNADKIFYAASLAKTPCAIYAYENLKLTSTLKENVKKMITISSNEAFEYILKTYGAKKLKEYAKNNIGMEFYIQNPMESYYGDTNAEEQLRVWKYLYGYINRSENGSELASYFVNDYYNDLVFEENNLLMHKYGLLGKTYHNVGLANKTRSPYIIIILTNGGHTDENSAFMKEISQKTYEINDRIAGN